MKFIIIILIAIVSTFGITNLQGKIKKTGFSSKK